jgi:hypothetical protein
MLHDKALQAADGQRAFQILPATGVFTGVGADIGAYRSNRVVRRDRFHGLLITPLEDEAHVTPGVGAHRTGGGARRRWQNPFPVRKLRHMVLFLLAWLRPQKIEGESDAFQPNRMVLEMGV